MHERIRFKCQECDFEAKWPNKLSKGRQKIKAHSFKHQNKDLLTGINLVTTHLTLKLLHKEWVMILPQLHQKLVLTLKFTQVTSQPYQQKLALLK